MDRAHKNQIRRGEIGSSDRGRWRNLGGREAGDGRNEDKEQGAEDRNPVHRNILFALSRFLVFDGRGVHVRKGLAENSPRICHMPLPALA